MASKEKTKSDENENNTSSALAEMATQCCTSRTVAFEWGYDTSLQHNSFSVISENTII